jgi:hypothetical protein
MTEDENKIANHPKLLPGSHWGKVELLGHRVHFGAVSEATIYGGTMLRVDVPTILNGEMVSFETMYYGTGALYGVRAVTLEQVIEANTPYAERYRAAALLTSISDDDDVTT